MLTYTRTFSDTDIRPLRPIQVDPAAHTFGVGDEARRAIEEVSRRIEVLAERLNVLGHFAGDDDGPKAA